MFLSENYGFSWIRFCRWFGTECSPTLYLLVKYWVPNTGSTGAACLRYADLFREYAPATWSGKPVRPTWREPKHAPPRLVPIEPLHLSQPRVRWSSSTTLPNRKVDTGMNHVTILCVSGVPRTGGSPKSTSGARRPTGAFFRRESPQTRIKLTGCITLTNKVRHTKIHGNFS